MPPTLEQVFKAGFRGFITTKDSPDYSWLVRRWSGNEQREPRVIFEPVCKQDVSIAIKYAVSNNLELAVVAGGHSFMAASSSEDGVHIDLRRMKRVRVDNKFGSDGTMLIEGGALITDVATACEASGTCTVLPAVKELGYTGFALGGGAGWTTGIQGFAVDQFLEVRIVLASGEIVTASNDSHPDLFWAVKGAGYNFGVVTSIKIKVKGLPSKVYFGTIVYPPASFEALFEAVEDYLNSQQQDDTLSLVYLTTDPFGRPAESIVALPYYHGPYEAEGNRRFQKLLDIPNIYRKTGLDWYSKTIDSSPEATWPFTHRYGDGTQFTRISPKVWLPVLERMKQWAFGEQSRCIGTSMFLGFYDWRTTFANSETQFGSAWPIRKPPGDGQQSWRDCAIYITTDKEEDEEAAIQTAKEITGLIRSKQEETFGTLEGGFRVYPNGSLLPGTTGEYIFGEHYPRLRKIKGKYDPNSVFHKKHPIEPDLSF